MGLSDKEEVARAQEIRGEEGACWLVGRGGTLVHSETVRVFPQEPESLKLVCYPKQQNSILGLFVM